MNITAFAGCALISCVLAVLIRQQKPELAAGVSIAASAIMMISLVLAAAPVIENVRALAGTSGVDTAGLLIILKCLGICLITQTAADICRDCGESSIAERIDAGGRIAVAAVSLPLFENIINLTVELIGP